MITFENIGLKPEIQKALTELGFEKPTSIQEKCVPKLLKSTRDLIALAQTGTGKTAAFSLPIIEQLDEKSKEVQAFIICPTRELCLQISKDIEKFTKHLKHISVVSVYGGERIDRQIKALKKGAHIVVGTPGRVCDLIDRKILKLGAIRWLVLDEADEMLDMGFKDDLDTILAETPETKQTLLFSATMPKQVRGIAKRYMHDAQEISVDKQNLSAKKVHHVFYMAHARDRYATLKRIIDMNPGIYGIIFCRTRAETAEVAGKLMADHYSAEPLHGDLTQGQRDLVMNRFRKKTIQLLVATDVAARGIDVTDLTHVINYNLPDNSETYVHRSGRTGRADKSGESISIINMREQRKVELLERMTGKDFEQKQIPLGTEVCEKQLFHLIDGVHNVKVDEKKIAPYLDDVMQKLETLDREELIKRFVSVEFNRFLEFYKDAVDLNVNARGGGGRDRGSRRDRRDRGDRRDRKGGRDRKPIQFSRVSINLGSKQNFRPKDLLGMINRTPNLKGIEIGAIDIERGKSFFGVDKNHEQALIKNLNNQRFGQTTLVVKSVSKKPRK